jgi:signal transduction histidine kinase
MVTRRRRWLGLVVVGLCALATGSVPADQPAGDRDLAIELRPPLRVALDGNFPPYTFVNANGEHQGMARDLWDLWSAKTGTPVTFRALDWSEARQPLATGEIDVIGTAIRSRTLAEQFALSAPYYQVDYFAFYHRDIPGIPDARSLRSYTVGAVASGNCAERLIDQRVLHLRLYPSFVEMAEAAIRGEVNVFCSARSVGLHYRFGDDAHRLFRRSVPLYQEGVVWAVRQDDPALRERIERGFSLIGAEERQAIETRWKGSALDSPWDSALVGRLRSIIGIALAIAAAAAIWGITLRRQVERRTAALQAAVAAQERSERRAETVIEQADDAILVLGGQTHLRCNGAARRLLGCSAPPDRCLDTCRMAPVQTLLDMMRDLFAGGRRRFDYSLTAADGTPCHLEIQLSPVGEESEPVLLVIMRDVTARRLREQERYHAIERLHELRRLETLSRLAGGVAHHFNNMLGAILGFAQFIAEDCEPGRPTHRHAGRIITATRRGKQLVEQILICAGETTLAPSRFALGPAIADTDWRRLAAIPDGVALALDIRDHSALVEADRPLLEQLLVHLLTNAVTAQGDRPGGITLRVADDAHEGTGAEAWARLMRRQGDGPTSPVEVWQDDEGDLWAISGSLAPRHRIVLTVADQGRGMTGEVISQAFTPFFTTAPPGPLVGLGLAVVHGLVQAHGWAVIVHSRPAYGTRVRIILPSTPSDHRTSP